MNQLETYIAINKLNSIQTMNDLQDKGIISDNCITVNDVADADCDRAVKWLKMEKGLL